MSKLEDVTKDLSTIGDLVYEWVGCVRNPARFCTETWQLAAEKEKVAAISRLLMTTLTLGLIIEIPIDKTLGIPWNEIGYYLSIGVAQLMIVLASALSFRISFALYKVPVKTIDIIVWYCAIIAVTIPPSALFSFAFKLELLQTLKSEKAAGEHFLSALTATYTHLVGSSSALLETLPTMVASAATYVLLIAFVRMLSRNFSISRDRLLKATAFTSGVLVFPFVAAPFVLFLYVLYAYV